MDELERAEQNVLVAADRWARNILRCSDTLLYPEEQELLDAVMYYMKLNKKGIDAPPNTPIPKPPLLPLDLTSRVAKLPRSFGLPKDTEFDFFERDTSRYSDIPTKPSPPFGTPIIDEEE